MSGWIRIRAVCKPNLTEPNLSPSLGVLIPYELNVKKYKFLSYELTVFPRNYEITDPWFACLIIGLGFKFCLKHDSPQRVLF